MGICVFYFLVYEYQVIKLDLVATFSMYSLEEEIDKLIKSRPFEKYQAL